ncbi:hypothetical protein D0X99_16495 [Algoriphagus lacus]|uniref:Outer membrane protein beta-barrel domain-containing protein n=1 Tax=Algoriphagus lacus TaxID=2056311 RepID=A0A418PNP2_9BACT|nr:outer membrane beta-barrel protein [Algoriphagus lacus]RIW13373.1 hypothetical protein D0X99_16495 [Algoriphagus lacus]
MKKATFVLILFFSAISFGKAQDLGHPRFGVGFQSSFPSFGLSGKYDFTEKHSAQAVLGFSGPFTSIYGRYLYNFQEKGDSFVYKPYLLGQLGTYSYKYTTFDDQGNPRSERENHIGFGVGAGIEFHVPEITDAVRLNIELGFNQVGFEFYDYSGFLIGIGGHYYFNTK